MAKEDEFSDNYVVLKPKRGGVLDLLRLLWTHDVGNNKFMDVSPGLKIIEFRRRLIVINSVIVQKALHWLEKPMAWVGSLLEMWLNLLYCNGNFAVLLFRFFQGKVVMPDKESAAFVSAIGCLDRRVDLSKDIKIGDCRYIAQLSLMASKISYENEAFIKIVVEKRWKMEFLGSYDFWNNYLERFSTQAFMIYDKGIDVVIVAFRGTSPFDASDWNTDFDLSWYELPSINCKVHGGFMKALGLQKKRRWPKNIQHNNHSDDDKPSRLVAYYTIREKLKTILGASSSTKYILTGHSLGGALAILFPMVLLLHEETLLMERLEGVYTFGQPRVGDEKLCEFMEEKLSLYGVKYFRFVYGYDIVTRLPYDDKAYLFKHFGTCVYHNSFYQGQIVKEEPDKNYSWLTWQIPKIINAVWELIRSFIIRFWKGSDYAEGWLLMFYRLFGLMIPGMADHALQDYVNAIRLSSSSLLQFS
ncbi:hypothetical protein Scep_001529 [Stephania cephalantha]|uniref:Fungal lipase-type domain-containing protein n=1 Tax=Stephania cephalantha TaxID=152367 RepID=A0AAP0L9I5_9MAGN